jgi:hypothetical protein
MSKNDETKELENQIKPILKLLVFNILKEQPENLVNNNI